MNSARNLLLHGTAENLPEVTPLEAGPLSMIYSEGEIRYIRLEGREVVRRLYVAVRDSCWSTVPSRVVKTTIEILRDSFRIAVHIESRMDDIDFCWENSIVGEARGRILFKVKGIARSSFLRNRIGLCVLFPAAECQSLPCVVTGSNGKKQKTSFPNLILPHQPFRGLTGLSYDPFPGTTLKLRLRGDTFEMEDQRNWGDASFKVYSTPLDLPKPVEVQKGDTVSQSATIELENTSPAQGERARWTRPHNEPVAISFDMKRRSTLPRIGTGLGEFHGVHSEEALSLLRRLHLSHLRVDLRFAQDTFRSTFDRATDLATRLNLPLECALFLSDGFRSELDLFAGLLLQKKPAVSTILVFEAKSFLTNPVHLEAARTLLRPLASHALLGGGTDSNFAELNRSPLARQSLELLSFSYNPQIHSTDIHSLIENLDGIRSAIHSAGQLARNVPISVSPVTFKFRYRLDHTLHPTLEANQSDPRTDPRQSSLFGAGLTVGILKHLAESTIHSATCFESAGPRGLLPASVPGGRSVYPLFHTLASVLSRPAAPVIVTTSSTPHRVQCLALQHQGELQMLLANLTPTAQEVEFDGPGLTDVRTRSLDESNVLCAIEKPVEFHNRGFVSLPAASRPTTLTIDPWAVTELFATGELQ